MDSVDLYDLNARYYNPKTARFLSEDPYFNLGNRVIGLYEINVPSVLSIMQANALYAYCGNAPVAYADPSGEIAITTIILVGSIAVGVIAATFTAYKSYQYTGSIDWNATLLTGVSWGLAAYTMGMSAYQVYVNFCYYYGYTPVSEIKFNADSAIPEATKNSIKGGKGFLNTDASQNSGKVYKVTDVKTYHNVSKTETIWDKIKSTADNMPDTKIPATFEIELNTSYKNPVTGKNSLWTNSGATKHMEEYISRSAVEKFSVGVRSQVILESYSSSLEIAMKSLEIKEPGRYFDVYGNWELGIDTTTGTVFHARMLD